MWGGLKMGSTLRACLPYVMVLGANEDDGPGTRYHGFTLLYWWHGLRVWGLGFWVQGVGA